MLSYLEKQRRESAKIVEVAKLLNTLYRHHCVISPEQVVILLATRRKDVDLVKKNKLVTKKGSEIHTIAFRLDGELFVSASPSPFNVH